MANMRMGSSDPGAAFNRYLGEVYPDERARIRFERRVRAIQLAADLMGAMDEMRQVSGLSKAEVATRMRRQPPAISRLLGGPDTNPTLATLIELLDALGCRLEVSIKPQPKDAARRKSPIQIRSVASRPPPRRPILA
jgi:hypothetical protein